MDNLEMLRRKLSEFVPQLPDWECGSCAEFNSDDECQCWYCGDERKV